MGKDEKETFAIASKTCGKKLAGSIEKGDLALLQILLRDFPLPALYAGKKIK